MGVGLGAPRTRLCGQSIPGRRRPAAAARLEPQMPLWREWQQQDERSNYSSTGGCWGSGWVGSSSAGAWGPQLAGPRAVAGGEVCGGRPGAGLRCPGAVDRGTMPCVSGGALAGGTSACGLRLAAGPAPTGPAKTISFVCFGDGKEVRVEEGRAAGWPRERMFSERALPRGDAAQRGRGPPPRETALGLSLCQPRAARKLRPAQRGDLPSVTR